MYNFKSKELYELALTHSSYANEHKRGAVDNYERLEFLGDAILDAVISERIFTDYPELTEGELTKMRASLVCEPMLAKKAAELSLNTIVKMGKGETQSGGGNKSSILCDLFESLVGAIFTDGGYEAARTFILPLFENDIRENRTAVNFSDAKSYLQEELQKRSRDPITYRIVSSEGPDHDKLFFVEALYCDKVIGKGSGRTKKEAEQSSALDAINKMKL
jgi:ribonuclease-3